ncbi:MAG TPA: mechanosensitive ion channel family protein [Vicinamibacterales bacterium]|nr:mechanosensitive ion channel family protein [Vicinamibacterales bacterium]
MESLTSVWRRAFDAPAEWQTLMLALVPALLIAWLAARLARRVLAHGLRALLRDTVATSSPLVRAPLRLAWAAVFILVLAVVAVPILQLAGLRPRAGLGLRTLATWMFTSGLQVILIGALAFVLVRLITLLVQRFEHEVNQGTGLDALERAKRARTLGSLIRNVAAAVITGVAVLMILNEVGVNIAPVLAGAGIVGLAVGFGAQTLVRDIISGFFLILEDQVRVGDVAAINGTGGLVEAINLRTIVLRDFEGTVHVFPNGAINTLANRSKDFSFYVIDLAVAYKEDPDRVTGVLREVGEELQKDDRFGPNILAPVEVVGVDAFADSAVVIKLRVKTVPLKQWEVGRELRRRILKAFERHGIEIPFPQRVVTTKPASIPTAPPTRASAPATPERS